MGLFNKKLRFVYYRNKFFRNCVNVIAWLVHPENRPNTGHLVTFREEDVIGPLQREEALFLTGMIRVLRPKTVVEFGFYYGHSTFNFLQALPDTSHLYSYDISEISRSIAEQYFDNRPNFHFLMKSQDAFSPEDVDGKQVDFVFIDASHDLELNKRTFTAILSTLAPKAILAIHDTGTWVKGHFLPIHTLWAKERPDDWINSDELPHQKDEREFVNWIGHTYPDFQILHFHSRNCIRHGLTLLQRSRIL